MSVSYLLKFKKDPNVVNLTQKLMSVSRLLKLFVLKFL